MQKQIDDPQRTMMQFLLAHRITQAIYVVAKLGVADELASGPRLCADIAAAVECDADALSRVLRALSGYGVFREDSPHTFALTPPAELLRSDAPNSLRPVALWCGSMAYTVFGDIEHTVRTGTPAFDHLFGTDFFSYLAANQDVSTAFDAFMARQTRPVATAVLNSYKFDDHVKVVDIGGGRGEMLTTLLGAYPTMRGVLFDREHVLDGVQSTITASGFAARCELVAGDMMQRIPGEGDVYLMKSIVHALDDEEACELLAVCREAMHESARLLLIEFVIPTTGTPHPGKLLDLMTLLGTKHGRERTEEEFTDLLTQSGLQLNSITPTAVQWSILEAVRAD